MGLRSIASVERPNVTVDISSFAGEGATIEFRAPRLADMMPNPAAFREVSHAYQLPRRLAEQVLLLSACYIRSKDDPSDLAPAAEFGRLANGNPAAFLSILGAFTDAYPMDFFGAVADAKNDSEE